MLYNIDPIELILQELVTMSRAMATLSSPVMLLSTSFTLENLNNYYRCLENRFSISSLTQHTCKQWYECTGNVHALVLLLQCHVQLCGDSAAEIRMTLLHLLQSQLQGSQHGKDRRGHGTGSHQFCTVAAKSSCSVMGEWHAEKALMPLELTDTPCRHLAVWWMSRSPLLSPATRTGHTSKWKREVVPSIQLLALPPIFPDRCPGFQAKAVAVMLCSMTGQGQQCFFLPQEEFSDSGNINTYKENLFSDSERSITLFWQK